MVRYMKFSVDSTPVDSIFRHKKFEVVYYNVQKLQYGDYRIRKAFCNKSEIKHTEFEAFVEKSTIKALDNESVHKIEIVLDR